MGRELDVKDVQILEALTIHGPRNLAAVARALQLPARTVRFRVGRLLSTRRLYLFSNVFCTNLGLKKSIVFAEATPGNEDLLFRCLQTHHYWIFLSRCYGPYEGCVGIYTLPTVYEKDFEGFLDTLTTLRAARSIECVWSTCFQSVSFKADWFDPKRGDWSFDWEHWTKEIVGAKSELPYTLIDPDEYPIRADETDMFILKELEKDASVNLNDIARMLGMTLAGVRYRYRNHILKRNLIENVDVVPMPFRSVRETIFFIFSFENEGGLGRFAAWLQDKPFVGGLGKALGQRRLIADVYLTGDESRQLIDVLSTLVRGGFLKGYRYFFLDKRRMKRQTFPYRLFTKGRWNYDSEVHLSAVTRLVSRAHVPTQSVRR